MVRLRSRTLGITSIIAICSLGGGSATQPVRSITDVDGAFSLRVRSLNDQYKTSLAAAEADRVQGLKLLLDQAMEKKDLDGAIGLREKLRAAEAELIAAKPPPRLNGVTDEVTRFEKALRDTA